MLRATPGVRRMSPARSNVSTVWCTLGGVTLKCRCMSASAGGRPNTCGPGAPSMDRGSGRPVQAARSASVSPIINRLPTAAAAF